MNGGSGFFKIYSVHDIQYTAHTINNLCQTLFLLTLNWKWVKYWICMCVFSHKSTSAAWKRFLGGDSIPFNWIWVHSCFSRCQRQVPQSHWVLCLICSVFSSFSLLHQFVYRNFNENKRTEHCENFERNDHKTIENNQWPLVLYSIFIVLESLIVSHNKYATDYFQFFCVVISFIV